ncbi:class I SAM-dependent methyltransferase [Chitinophaga nivalis]|uniref:Class I SAM-dependent methyltransferase n=1 Tax=Chitinophaga nivalis TaxID=2991709 RepID=A0ABT3IV71_9BACT|nr:class I SAM-dependent methyltransferase [Chitinophaga nivalis]MCW3462444.1 class I SAM-dependent methyltransferase [Chitinophaga nivalis]MCW3487865.1 class I SAM-dependent methyltransferase [Chitinophaga nivalis]
MDTTHDYLSANKEMWNQRTGVHVKSDFYDMPGFLQGNTSLKAIELALLGDVQDKTILHLQCHFGQDTLSLARMGATVTGMDLSDAAIHQANTLTEQLQLTSKARFVCCDLYSLPAHLEGTFDRVFTSYGTIGWLPDLDKWAGVIAHFLKPGGHFIMADFHPVVWMFDDNFTTVAYDYFNTAPIIEESTGTYTDRQADLKHVSYSWNHPLSEIITSLTSKGLQLQVFEEHDYSPYNCFNNTIEKDGRFYIKGMEGKLPMVYAFKFLKPY